MTVNAALVWVVAVCRRRRKNSGIFQLDFLFAHVCVCMAVWPRVSVSKQRSQAKHTHKVKVYCDCYAHGVWRCSFLFRRPMYALIIIIKSRTVFQSLCWKLNMKIRCIFSNQKHCNWVKCVVRISIVFAAQRPLTFAHFHVGLFARMDAYAAKRCRYSIENKKKHARAKTLGRNSQ